MPNNYLVTGSPGIGKTTVIKRVVSNLKENGYVVGGLYCPEIKESGRRKGFKIKDLMDGETKILAHINQEKGPKISKYRVNVENVDQLSKKALENALKETDIIVIDEIAPMEIYSQEFKEKTWEALENKKPLLAAIHKRTKTGYIGKIKDREDTETIEITKKNRDKLPEKIIKLITM